MSRAFREAEKTPWIGGKRIRAYDAGLTSLGLLVAMIVALPLGLFDPQAFALPALALFVLGFAGALLLRVRALKGLRLNNGGVAQMTRGEDVAASTAFRAAATSIYGRDVVAMSLHNLGVLALRSLDLPSAVALQRAARAAGRGFRLPWQPSYAAEFAGAQLAFALAASGGDAELDEAAALVDADKPPSAPLAIAFAARARALLLARRGRFEETVDVLDGERALLRNVLPLNDAVLCEALLSYALLRLDDALRGAPRAHSPVLADDPARAYVKLIFPACEAVLVA